MINPVNIKVRFLLSLTNRNPHFILLMQDAPGGRDVGTTLLWSVPVRMKIIIHCIVRSWGKQ